jgi:hypothetical protein
MADSWGIPEQATFARRFIRQVAVEDVRIKVHVVLLPIIEQLLQHLHAQQLAIARIEGYPSAPFPHGDGLVLELRGADIELTERAMLGYGFEAKGEHCYRWGGTFEEARTRAAAVEQQLESDFEAAVAAPPAPAAAAPVWGGNDWYSGLPGARELHGDERGRDVLFLQLFLQLAPTGSYDESTQAAIVRMKATRGMEATPHVSTEVWQQLLPRYRPKLRRGDTGQRVRMVSAAVAATGVLDVERVTVHSVYSSALAAEVRTWQEAEGIPVTGVLTTFDWERLLAHPWATV